MPETQSRHARRRDRLAMAGPTIPSRMAADGQMDSENDSDEDLQASKENRKYRGKTPQEGVYLDEAMGDLRESRDGFGRY
jgi:hypothetical protein